MSDFDNLLHFMLDGSHGQCFFPLLLDVILDENKDDVHCLTTVIYSIMGHEMVQGITKVYFNCLASIDKGLLVIPTIV